jgi:hypothetical protein
MEPRTHAVAADHGADFIAPVGFEPAFSVTIEHDPPDEIAGPHGTRLFRKVTGGEVRGKIAGSIYPNGAGEYSLARDDRTIDVSAHLLLRDAAGEWVYLYNQGYLRPDGYYRVTSWVDADVRGDYGWTSGLFFIGSGRLAADGRSTTIDYYEVT